MSEKNGAQDIAFRSAIAACNSGPNLRVYMQDVSGKIRESVYDGEWGNGTEKNVIATAKLGTPIACATKDLKMIRVYYMSADNTIKEAAYDNPKGWHESRMEKSRVAVAPYSKLAACSLEGQGMATRVYCQMPDNTIQEFGMNEGESSWKKMQNLGVAMPGSEIACTSFKMNDMMCLRVYFQDMHEGMVEKCFDTNKGWHGGTLKLPDMLPRTAMACTSFMIGNNVGIRLFYATSNRLLEMAWDGKKWVDGNFHVDCIPGTEVACVSWGSGNHLNIRVYFQKGELVSGISEWMWNQGNWKAGKLTIPPA